jgi:hygromycin-B 7''-O-kinase
MVGFGEFDLLGPSTFLAGGDARLVRALVAGFGHSEPASLRGLSHRLMRMLLLHRFSDFRVQVRIEGGQDRARTIDDLRRMLWPFDDDG